MERQEGSYDDLLQRALQRITELNDTNKHLSSELAAVSSRVATWKEDQDRASDLEQENRQLTSELEAARKRLASLKEIVGKSLSDLKVETQNLNRKLEAACTVLDLYELLYEVKPTRGEAQPAGKPEARDDEEDHVVVSLENRLRMVREEPVVPPEATPSEQQPEQVAWTMPGISLAQDDQPELTGSADEIELVVSPFTRFDSINRFTAAVRSLSGVTGATVRHFQKGTLRMVVEYESLVPLVNRLRDLPQFKLGIESASERRIVASLESTEREMAGASGAR